MTDPLAIISTRIEVMLMEAEEHTVPAAVVDDLTVLDRNVKRLWVTLEALRRAAGARPEGSRPMELNHVVKGPALLLERLGRAEGVRITVRLDPSEPVILSDPTALGEAVAGLLADARAAVSRGDELRIETGPVQHHPERTGLTIATSGHAVADWAATALSPDHSRMLAHDGGTVAVRSDAASTVLTLDFPRLAFASHRLRSKAS
jgi:C4-dicarboxylate-specific signal transduction histidine kinase